MTSNATVELKGISKAFSGVKALDNVNLKAFAGECLGLVGENGAGKSTLMKVLSGVWPAGSFEGEILIEGKPQRFLTPLQASMAGIGIIHQELSLFRELSVAENIFIQRLPNQTGVLSRAILKKKTEHILNRLHFPIDPDTPVKELSVGESQLVEIARVFTRPVKVLIFDEPTSALADHEISTLFQVIKELKSQGVACIYISHKLPEIRELCERVTVLRDGQSVAHFSKNELVDERIIEAMVGRQIGSVFPPKRPPDAKRETILEVKNLSVKELQSEQMILKDVNFSVKKGEIFGIAGLMGSKRTELLLSLFGAIRGRKLSGEFVINGKPVAIESPQDAIREGLGLVTEDRKITGLVLEMDVKSNLTFPILQKISKLKVLQPAKEIKIVDYYRRALRIKTPNEDFKVRFLSGGNQQKVILARWLSTEPKILLLDEPTRGIDVMAKAEIYHLMRELVDQGLTLILVSSELPEVVSLSDRVLVMREGRVAGLLENADVTQQRIMETAAA